MTDAGGVFIGDNCSISVNTIIYSASHEVDNEDFQYYEKQTKIKNGVWIGARTTILAGADLENYCVIGAESLVMPKIYKEYGIYGGSPVKFIKKRNITKTNDLKHNMVFR